MSRISRACACLPVACLVLALQLVAPAVTGLGAARADPPSKPVDAPANYVPEASMAFGERKSPAVEVSRLHPLPVMIQGLDSETSLPCFVGDTATCVAPGTGGGGGGGTGDASHAAQLLQITQETAINTELGLKGDTACATDTGSCSNNAQMQRVMQRLTTLNTTIGTPFQAGGSIGNTSFASTQSGTWNITNVSGTVSLPTGAATAANQSTLLTAFGAKGDTACATDTGSCSNNAQMQRLAQRLSTLNTTLGTPFQAGGSIGNTSFGISGTLPAFASTPTFNCGTGCGTAANFLPDNASLVSIAPTGTSSQITLGGSGATVQVKNNGLVAEHYRLGTSGSVTALTTDDRIYPGACIQIPRGANTNLAMITDSGTGAAETVTGSGGVGVCQGTDLNSAPGVRGTVAPGASGNADAPVKDGGLCKTSDPTAKSDGQIVEQLHDCLGKAIVIPAVRVQKGVQTTTITSSASETTILTAGSSGVFNDVYGVIFDNTSATAGHCDVKDATSGTTRFSLDVPATQTGGFTLDVGSAIVQASAANNWTATCTSLASWKITILYVATKG